MNIAPVMAPPPLPLLDVWISATVPLMKSASRRQWAFATFFRSGFRAGEELVGKSLIRAEDADVDVGEGNDDGAGESSGVDEMRCAKLLGVVDAIGEDESAFGVGIEDFDRLAGHSSLGCRRASGLCRRACFR